MGIEELFHFCVSQGLNVQLRAFVCLTASDELMNGLFNKPSRHVKGKEQKKKKLPDANCGVLFKRPWLHQHEKLEGLNLIVQDPWRRPRPALCLRKSLTHSPTLRRGAPLSFISVVAASVIRRQRGQEPGPP